MKWYTVCDSRLKAARWINTAGCCCCCCLCRSGTTGLPSQNFDFQNTCLTVMPLAAAVVLNSAVNTRRAWEASLPKDLACGRNRSDRQSSGFEESRGDGRGSFLLYWTLLKIFLFAKFNKCREKDTSRQGYTLTLPVNTAVGGSYTDMRPFFILNLFCKNVIVILWSRRSQYVM